MDDWRLWFWARLARLGINRHGLVEASADAGAWILAIVAGMLLRHDWEEFDVQFAHVALGCLEVIVLQALIGSALGLYTGRWRRGSFEEVSVLARSVILSTLCLAAVVMPPSLRLIPISVVLGSASLALVLMAAHRYLLRVLSERRLRPSGESGIRIVVIGAGEAGAQVVRSMMHTPTSPYVPVALLDDDPAKARLTLSGVEVRGTRRDLQGVAAQCDADAVLIAIPSATAEVTRELSETAQELGLDVNVLPGISTLFHRPVSFDDIRPITPADLLGRNQAEIDIEAVAGYLRGQRVLVTGAGGSIGSELCRQIRKFEPAQLIMVDRDESALHAVQLSLEGQALLDRRDLVVADIRDRLRMHAVFAEHRPHVVFHTAALKHLPLLEMHPSEAVKTNVFGTLNLLEVAAAWDVSRFVNVSTDKAADPTSVLGFSKRIAERLTAWSSPRGEDGCTALSVRFGNVLGSRGSVLTTFTEQIRQGGPVTVTHPDVTRYFMTVEEAVQLVIEAGAVGRQGEVLVLDMGKPVRIVDVAKRLISESRLPIELAFTGLRPGEKLHEALLGDGETDLRPVHRLIAQVPVPPLDPADLELLDPPGEVVARQELVRRMRALSTGGWHPRPVPDAPTEQLPTLGRPVTINLDAMVDQARLAPGFGG